MARPVAEPWLRFNFNHPLKAEELRQAMEGAERVRKQAETELLESNERASMLHVQNMALINQKKKIEATLSQFKIEAEEAMMAAIEAEVNLTFFLKFLMFRIIFRKKQKELLLMLP